MHLREIDADAWDDLVDRLAVHNIRYLMGGHGCPVSTADGATFGALVVDLAHAGAARLRDAIVALLLRHPEGAPGAEEAARNLPADDPASRLLLESLVVAAALQREWAFSLGIYLPGQPAIQADRLAAELGLPRPRPGSTRSRCGSTRRTFAAR